MTDVIGVSLTPKEILVEESRLPTRSRCPAVDDASLESRAKELIEIFKDVDF